VIPAIFRDIVRSVYRIYCRFRLRFRYADLKIDSHSIISFDNIGIRFGKGVYVGAFAEIVIISNTSMSEKAGSLEVGDRVVIGKNSNIRAAGGTITIGKGGLLAQNVSLIAANHSMNSHILYRDQTWDSSRTGVSLERNVWVGTGTIVLPGVAIGENSVIAAGSVVTKSVPPNQVWGGNPARLIRTLG
jgi:acetyltransferase-like isoleucine patch superfamily enzyme